MDQAEPASMKPLEGTRIVTVEQFGAGPYGSMFLADLGAEVVKIENTGTGGDTARHIGPAFLGEADSEYFQTFNAGKRSVTLDLKSDEGRAALRRLAAGADAVMNNLRGDQPEKLGLDYQSLAAVNPAIVCLHISAYGRDNERKAWPGYDFLMQAEAGLMSLTGEPDGPPQRFGSSLIDFMTGITGVVGLLSCVMRARQTGKGCDVDVSLFDVAMHQLSYPGTWHINGGPMPSRLPRSAHQSISPVQTVRTRDGWIYVMCMKEKDWEALARLVGHGAAPAPRRADAFARRGDEPEDHRGMAGGADRASAGGAGLRRGPGCGQSVRGGCGHGAHCPAPGQARLQVAGQPAQGRRRAPGAVRVLGPGRRQPGDARLCDGVRPQKV
jgi:crotonobetainyl-CoA:carnitine CoA-transferase CaiB-like acyl-CoA transferase